MNFTFMSQMDQVVHGTKALKYRALPNSVILGQGSLDWTRWNWRWDIKSFSAQDAGTLHSLQEAEALHCGMFGAWLPHPTCSI